MKITIRHFAIIFAASLAAYSPLEAVGQRPSTNDTLGLPVRSLYQEELSKIPPLPEGFTPIFNGVDLTGWHISKSNFHGTTPDFRVVHGMIVGTQYPVNSGGVLLTDKHYKNFELYMEVKPDWGNDSGIFLRSNENGQAYQVTMDYIPGGDIGRIYGEGLEPLQDSNSSLAVSWYEAWRREEWNQVRVRITGDVPHIQVWINDILIRDWTDTKNHSIGGATEGMIAIQIHMNGAFRGHTINRWIPGGMWRWRTIAVKELPDNL